MIQLFHMHVIDNRKKFAYVATQIQIAATIHLTVFIVQYWCIMWAWERKYIVSVKKKKELK